MTFYTVYLVPVVPQYYTYLHTSFMGRLEIMPVKYEAALIED